MKIIVIGASSGIGLALFERLLDQGNQVLGTDFNSPPQVPDSYEEYFSSLDVRDVAAVDSYFLQAESILGEIEVVVNCAGVLGPVVTTEEYDPIDARFVTDVNLMGAFYVTAASLRAMLPKKYGRIVHLASIAGKEGNPGQAMYSASKAGVIGLVKAVAKECADQGITINAIAPASIDTPLLLGMTPERREIQKSLIPMRRFGDPAEVAALIEFMISPSNSFTTGFVFDASGGRAVY